ncbi:hypothetical protein DTL42_13565 [Bremerella cremea]|uniref:Uncharacterized protein n=1 Tax=Bremerella cremea TaxID=1031537 RepID=A0A368KQ80_9BACT|nr:hypothetical protein DTL42_13565 [Bremerella cremea]
MVLVSRLFARERAGLFSKKRDQCRADCKLAIVRQRGWLSTNAKLAQTTCQKCEEKKKIQGPAKFKIAFHPKQMGWFGLFARFCHCRECLRPIWLIVDQR